MTPHLRVLECISLGINTLGAIASATTLAPTVVRRAIEKAKDKQLVEITGTVRLRTRPRNKYGLTAKGYAYLQPVLAKKPLRCDHPEFQASVNVNRIVDAGAFSADVRITCKTCGTEFEFGGMQRGHSPSAPMVSFDGTEARLPIAPRGSWPTHPTAHHEV